MTYPALRNLGSRLELFVDDYLIDRLTGCRLKMHEPRSMGAAVKFDKPWEGLFAACISVIKDGGRYRMYYRGLPEAKPDGTNIECTCVAESGDGVTWTKPELELFDYFGHKRNNIIIHAQPPASHNFSPFLDTRPGVPENERYKAVAGLHESGIFVYASGDGLRWRRLSEKPVIESKPFAFDSQNVAFWSEHEGCYAFYFRTWKGLPDWSKAVRWVSRCVSEDFIHWSEPVEMDAGGAPPEQIYTQGTQPYFRAPHIYISLAARFQPGKQVLTDADAKKLGVAEGYYGDCSDAVLMTSRGGARYDRTFMESFLRPGPGLENWVSRTNYPGLGVVPTGVAGAGVASEMSFYCHRNYAQPTAHAGRFTLRTDGFVSMNAPYAGGEMVTRPLTFTGNELVLNYATSAAGSVRVEVQEADGSGKPLAGFALADCKAIVGDQIERAVAWGSGINLSSLSGRPLRLRFVMKDTDLYSMRFR